MKTIYIKKILPELDKLETAIMSNRHNGQLPKIRTRYLDLLTAIDADRKPWYKKIIKNGGNKNGDTG
ncbi:MAG: hypothetical protein GY841_18030 [FCB group bacterium]|nr:hypothetical protein [FCB group bacterium]